MSNRHSGPGVPLADLRAHPNCGVEIHCDACAQVARYPLEAVIARLEARGLSAQVGIVDLARHIEGPCKRCGARSWVTRPAYRMEEPDRSPAPSWLMMTGRR